MTISTQRLRFLRGNTAASSVFTGLGGELIVDTTLNTIRVQDGYTPGGTLLATAADLANVVLGEYGNANVASYLPTYTGNIATGNIVNNNYVWNFSSNGILGLPGGASIGDAYNDSGTYLSSPEAGGGIASQFGNAWVEAVENAVYIGTNYFVSGYSWSFTNTGNLIIPGSINYANGVNILSGISANGGGNYSNANVASYLPTYTGNVNAAYFTGNGALLTGIVASSSNYGNANVAAYLPDYGGVVKAYQINNPDYVNIASQTGFQLQYDPTGVYNVYDIANGSWLYFDAGGLVWESNVSGVHHNVYFDNFGNITAGGNIQAPTLISPNLIMSANTSLTGNSTYISVTLSNNSWTFGSDGNLTLPESNTGQAGFVAPFDRGISFFTNDLESGPAVTRIGQNGTVTIPNSLYVLGDNRFVIFDNLGNVAQKASNTGENFELHVGGFDNKVWTFDADGDLTLPDIPDVGGRINAANNIKLKSGSNTWDFAPNGELTLPGDRGKIGLSDYTNGIDLYNNNGGVGYVKMNYGDQSYVWVDPAGGHIQTSGGNWNFNANGVLTSSGNIVAPNFIGNVTGDIGTFNTLYGQLGTAAQPSITSLGTLTGLAVGGAINTTTLQVSGNATIGNLLVTGTSTIIGNINMISGNSGQFFGNSPTGFNALYTGIAAGYTPLNQTIIQSSGNYNDYVQVNLENVNSGNAATGDYVVTADNGTDSTYYIDMGIASSNFDGLSPNIVGNSVRANDAYLYTMGNGAGNQGGNLIIGAGTASKVVKIIAGGGHDHDVIAQVSSSLFTVFGSTTANGNVTTGSYFIGNGSQLTGVQAVSATTATSATYVTGLTSANVITALGYTPTNYGDSNVAIYSGNIVPGNISLSGIGSSGKVQFKAAAGTNGAYIYDSTGSIFLAPNTSYSGTAGVAIGGSGFILGPNSARNLTLNYNNVAGQVGVQANLVVGTTAAGGNISVANSIVASGNVQGTYFIGNGALLTGITASSSYGNTNVAAYLASNSAVPITTTSNITASYYIGNGSLLTGIVANTTYSNTNVASYLTGNIVVGNISGNEPNVTLVANTYSYVFSNVGNVSFPGNLTVVSNVSVGNIFATGYYYANGAAFTGTGGSSNYGDSNVAAYLPTYTGNVKAAYFIGNGSTLTSITAANVSGTVANATYATSATYVTGLTSANVTTALGYTPTTYANTNVAAYLTGSISTGAITTSGNIYGSVSYNQPNFIQPNASDGGWAFGTYTDGASNFWMQTKFFGLNQATRGFRVYEAEGASTVFSVNGAGDAVASNSLETVTIKAPFFTGTGTIGSGRRITLDPDNNTVNYIRIDGDDGGGERLVISSQLSTSNGIYFYLRNSNVFRMADNQFMYPDSTWQSTAYPGTSTALSLIGNIAGGNLTATGNVTGTYFIGNGALLTGISASSNYGNSNVASFLGSYGSNTIVTTGNVTASYFVGNGALLTGITATANYNDANVATFLSNIGSNAIVTTGNITASYFVGNGALLTGIVASGSTYSNTNVAAFLSNIGSNAIVTTGNITASYFVGNGALLTGMYSNSNVVSMLAANANLTIGNVGTAYNTASNITTLFVGNSTTIVNGGSGSGQTNLLNNMYYDSANALRYRNTQTGAAQLTIGGSGGFSFSGTSGSVTANAANGNGVWAGLSSSAFQTYNSIPITSAGALTTSTGVLTTGAVVSTLFNTVASTVNMGGAATTIAMGASTVAVSIGGGTGNLTVGNITVGNISNNLNVIGNLTVSSVIASGSGTYTGNLIAGNLSTPGTGGNISGVNILYGNVVGSGNSTVQNFTVNSSATVGGTLGVTGDTVFTSNVTINGPVAGYAPARPAVRLYGNTSTYYTSGTTISNQLVDYNQGSYYSNSTGLFTVPVAGLYHCYATIRVGNNNALNQAAILKNNTLGGANVIAFWETDTNTGTAVHFSITGYAKCVAGDTLSLKVVTGNVQFDSNDNWGVTYIG